MSTEAERKAAYRWAAIGVRKVGHELVASPETIREVLRIANALDAAGAVPLLDEAGAVVEPETKGGPT